MSHSLPEASGVKTIVLFTTRASIPFKRVFSTPLFYSRGERTERGSGLQEIDNHSCESCNDSKNRH